MSILFDYDCQMTQISGTKIHLTENHGWSEKEADKTGNRIQSLIFLINFIHKRQNMLSQ